MVGHPTDIDAVYLLHDVRCRGSSGGASEEAEEVEVPAAEAAAQTAATGDRDRGLGALRCAMVAQPEQWA